MRRKIMSIFIIVLFCMLGISNVIATNENPEITDDAGDAFGYIDIDSVWFFEKEEQPEYLFVSMRINNPSFTTFQQTFAAFWKLNGIQYSCGLHRGFSLKRWDMYSAGKYHERDLDLEDVEGSYYLDSGVITWMIPKEFIGSPEKGDVLEDTWSNAFRRLGVIGRIGFTRVILDEVILRVFGNNMWDYAPERGTYGETYTIRY